MGERFPHVVPDPVPQDLYGVVEFFDGVEVHKLTIGVAYCGTALALGLQADEDIEYDIVLDPHGWVLKHPYGSGREATEDERAAVGWTW